MARPIDADALREKYADKLSVRLVFGYDAGFVDGIRAALEMPTLTPPNDWVSVEERLPKPGERVLAANGDFVGEAYMASNGAWMRHDGFPWEVDAWMPLPASPDRRPPEGEEDANV